MGYVVRIRACLYMLQYINPAMVTPFTSPHYMIRKILCDSPGYYSNALRDPTIRTHRIGCDLYVTSLGKKNPFISRFSEGSVPRNYIGTSTLYIL